MAITGWKLTSLAALLALAGTVCAKPTRIPLRDLEPAYEKGGLMMRSRTSKAPGLTIGGKRLRGLSVTRGSRVAYLLDGRFAKLEVKVGVLDGGKGPVRFLVHGRGRVLASTPPLFPGAEPVQLEVPLDGVLILELEARGAGRGRAAWMGGLLYAAPGKDLTKYLAIDQPFNPGAYPTAFRRRVNEGIGKGVQYLRLMQQTNGTWELRSHTMGVTALAALAMLKAGVKPEDPAVQGAFAQLRGWKPNHVYTCAVLLMAIEARYFPEGANPREAKRVIPDRDRDWIVQLASWLAKQQGGGYPEKQRPLFPVWRYPHGGWDLSNTQYALFGLAAANRCGVPTSKVWMPTLRFLLGVQEKEGPKLQVSRYFKQGEFERRRYEHAQARGFGYHERANPTGAMTSAGLCSLVLCQQALARNVKFQTHYAKRTRAGIRDALAWLEEYYDLRENPFQPGAWWAYYLFNMERVGVLLDQRYIGTRDWYREGSELLLAAQRDNGGLPNGIVGTSFALLFWKRATVAARTSPLK
ncbi:MAG: NPCBM/NEW2 domain-containing protein [Planctomycetota bacterium]